MNALRLIPVYISALLLGAHFYRNYDYVLMGISLIVPFIMIIRKAWVPRVMQLYLLLGAAEWIRTTYLIVFMRQQMEMPWMRMAIILIAVALFTALSCLLFQFKGLKKRYGMK